MPMSDAFGELDGKGDWDPPEHQRQYFHNTKDGGLGYLVIENGVQKIRLDRPGQQIIRAYKPSEWTPAHEERKWTEAQITEVAFAADTVLNKLMGDHERARKVWYGLRDEERIAWIRQGPIKDPVRRNLYRAIKDVLMRYVREDG